MPRSADIKLAWLGSLRILPSAPVPTARGRLKERRKREGELEEETRKEEEEEEEVEVGRRLRWSETDRSLFPSSFLSLFFLSFYSSFFSFSFFFLFCPPLFPLYFILLDNIFAWPKIYRVTGEIWHTPPDAVPRRDKNSRSLKNEARARFRVCARRPKLRYLAFYEIYAKGGISK